MSNLRDVGRIEYRSEDPGNPVPTWSTFAGGVRCEVISVGGGEKVRGHQVEETTKFVVRVRYRDGITSAMRFVPETGPFAGRTLNIDAVQLEDFRVSGSPLCLQLHCKE
jgi:head-tail adaptor